MVLEVILRASIFPTEAALKKNLFPTEPTDEATKNQKTQMITRLGLLVFTAEDGT